VTTKPETVIKQIEELPKIQRLPLLQFKDWLIEEEDSSMTNVGNYLRVLKLFSIELGNKEFKNISREDVLDFLNRRKKSIDVDPDKKWVRTWNNYFARLIGFYRWLYNNEITLDREDWNTPEPFNTIKKKKNKRDSSYSPNDVWEIGDLLLAIKYCDNIRDKAVFTIGWDMVSRNHELVKVKIKDIIIKEKYAEISTSSEKKIRKIWRQKGVDTLMAIDMVDKAASNQYELAILIASDLDHIEAVRAVKSRGKQVMGIYDKEKTHGELIASFDTRYELKKEDGIDCMLNRDNWSPTWSDRLIHQN